MADNGRTSLTGRLVIVDKDAITAADRKKLEKLGAVVIEKKPGHQLTIHELLVR